MKFSYLFTDFPSEMKSGGTYILKCMSFVITDTPWGDMIFDTGSPTDTDKLGDFLRSIGTDAAKIRYVFCTHVHPDHAGGNGLFRNAAVILSRRDYVFGLGIAQTAFSGGNMLEYLLQTCPGYRSSYGAFEAAATVHYMKSYWDEDKLGISDGRVRFIEDSPDLPDFVTPVFCPGHTYGHYAFRLNVCKRPVFVTGDAVSNRFILKEAPSHRLNEPHVNFDDYFASVELFRDDNALLIPGHDRPFFVGSEKTIRRTTFCADDIDSQAR